MDNQEAQIGGVKPLFANGSYTQPIGYFGVMQNVKTVVGTEGRQVDTQKLHWYGCREQFHNYVDPLKMREYYYSHNPDRAVSIANFIYIIESQLGLVEKTSFMYTEKNTISWIVASPFWVENPMRHQFLTISLRAALSWVRGTNTNWRAALLAHPYAAATPAAVERFLSGYTRYTGNTRGWYKQFTGQERGTPLTPQVLTTLLIKPRHTEAERFSVIEKSAYLKWEQAGCPNGRAEEFWAAAVKEYIE